MSERILFPRVPRASTWHIFRTCVRRITLPIELRLVLAVRLWARNRQQELDREVDLW